MLSSRPVRPLVPTSVDVPSSSDKKNCDRPAGGAEERNEKRDAAAARWKKLFATQSPARAEERPSWPWKCFSCQYTSLKNIAKQTKEE